MKAKTIDNLNFKQFMQNPMGSATTFGGNREIIKEGLYSKYLTMIKNVKDFEHYIYRYKDNYIFHFKIPSEKFFIEKMTYDVVLEFIPETSDSLELKSIDTGYRMRFFSNSPSFTFTYAYVLFHNDMTVAWLDKHLSKESIKKPPEIRNPVQSFGFEKTCYIAAIYIKNHDYTDKKILNNKAKEIKNPLEFNKIYSEIMSCENKVAQYQKAGKLRSKHNKQVRRLTSKKINPPKFSSNKGKSKKPRNMKANMQANMKSNMKANMKLKKKK